MRDSPLVLVLVLVLLGAVLWEALFPAGTVWLGGPQGNFPSCPGGLLSLHVGGMETLGTPAVGRNSLEQPLPAAMWV